MRKTLGDGRVVDSRDVPCSYFIGFSWQGPEGNGLGNMEILREAPIRTWEELQGVARSIEDGSDGRFTSIVITNWQRFEGWY